jgi:hypothetical protein
VEAGNQLGDRAGGVRHRGPELAGVEVARRGAEVDLAGGQALGRHGQGRDVRRVHDAVGRDDDVAGEAVAFGVDQRRQAGAADLLLPFDEEGQADRRPALGARQRLDRLQRGEEPALVIRGAAGVDPPVSLRRLERRRFPEF